MGLPFGRALLAAVGLVVLGMCAWQFVVTARGDFADTLSDEKMSPRARRVVLLTARIGIPARALAVVPVGIFLRGRRRARRPRPGEGARRPAAPGVRQQRRPGAGRAGRPGFAVFAVYSLLEARYRQVASGA